MKRDHPEAREIAGSQPLPAAPVEVVAALRPFLTEERAARIERCVAERTRAVIPVLEAVDDPRNVAAVLRSADAFGIQEVHLIEGSQPFLASRRVTQGAELWLELVRHASPEACVAALRARGYKVYVATMDGDTAPEELRREQRVAVVFGNEQSGVAPATAALCDRRYAIPMRGFAQSLNVSVAAAITLYAATRGRSSELDADEQAELRARFMFLSVPRADAIVREHLARRAE